MIKRRGFPSWGFILPLFVAGWAARVAVADHAIPPPLAAPQAVGPGEGEVLDGDGSDGAFTIDVMLLFTQEAYEDVGGADGAAAAADMIVTGCNNAYGRSEVNQQLRLVHHAVLDYSEDADPTSVNMMLAQLATPNDGYMDETHALRDQYGADLVQLIMRNAQVGGIAYLPLQIDADSPETAAWSLVSEGSMGGGMVSAHEWGHNMGCHHDRENGGPALFPYAYGYRFLGNSGTLWRTIMAYAPGNWIPYFSNPRLLYDGQPLGIEEGSFDSADNAQALNNSASAIASFRATRFLVASAGPNQRVGDPDQSGDEPVTLDGTNSQAGVGRTIVSYEWREAGVLIANGAAPTVPLPLGTHVIELTVADDASPANVSTDTATIEVVSNLPPVALTGHTQSYFDEGADGFELVSVDGSRSFDPDGTITAWEWRNQNGQLISTEPVGRVTLQSGEHLLLLTVYDNGAPAVSATETLRIYVGGTIRVPADVPTIQDGVDVSRYADTVLVADGVYSGIGNRNIQINQKVIRVASENGPENCIIDCGGAAGTEDRRAFVLYRQVGARPAIEGFTIRNGRVTGMANFGGAIVFTGVDVRIRNCVFEGNNSASDGGALYYVDADPLVEGNVFRDNSASNGGAIATGYGARGTLRANVIMGNHAQRGGGIKLGGGASIRIEGNRIEGNTAGDSGGGLYLWGESTVLTSRNNVYAGNTSVWYGGGFTLSSPNSTSVASFANDLVLNNASVYGGGIYLARGTNWTVVNSVLRGNLSTAGGPAIRLEGGAGIAMTHSDVAGGWIGAGNFDADPLFVDPANGDFHLSAGSPCIDSADSDAAPALDAQGNGRYDDPSVADTGIGTQTYADRGPFERGGTPPPIDGTIVDLAVTPGPIALNPGESVRFQAVGFDAAGRPFPLDAAWTATGGGIDDTGLHTATGSGQYTVTATFGGLAADAIVGVPRVLTTFEVQVDPRITDDDPDFFYLVAGQTRPFTVRALDQFGRPLSVPVVWSASSGSIDAGGLYTAPTHAAGVSISATAGGFTDTVTGYIANQPTITAITGDTWGWYGETRSQSVTFTNLHTAGGTAPNFHVHVFLSRDATLDSSDPYVFDAYTPPLGPGAAHTMAISFAIPADWPGEIVYPIVELAYHAADWRAPDPVSLPVTITQIPPPVVSGIVVSPSAVTLGSAAQQQFSAQAIDQYGQPIAAAVSWSATGGTITSTGLYTAPAVFGGPFTVTASSGVVSGSATVTMQAPVLATITLTPAVATVLAGGTAPFSAQGTSQYGEPIAATFTWSATRGTVTSGGLYTAPASAGSDTVQAVSGPITGTAAVTVLPSVTLEIQAVYGAINGVYGNAVQQRAVVRNTGSAASPAATLRMHWSANAALDASDLPAGSANVPALAPGQTVWVDYATTPVPSSPWGIGTWIRVLSVADIGGVTVSNVGSRAIGVTDCVFDVVVSGPNSTPNVIDLSKVQDILKGIGGGANPTYLTWNASADLPRYDAHGNLLSPPDGRVDVVDISREVDAIKGLSVCPAHAVAPSAE